MCITFVVVKDKLLIQSIKAVSERAQRNADVFWKTGRKQQAETLAFIDVGERSVVCHPWCPLTLLTEQFPHLVSPTPGNAHSGTGPPWLNMGFASSSPCFEAWLTLQLTSWAAENIPHVEELLGYFRKVLETILVSRSSPRQHNPQQGPSPHGKMRFKTTRLSPGHCYSLEPGASKCC